MAVVVEVLSPTLATTFTADSAKVVEIVQGTVSPLPTVNEIAVVDVVRPGGTVVNVGAGYGLPPAPYEGQIWIDLS